MADESAAPKTKRSPPANLIVGQARVEDWDKKISKLIDTTTVSAAGLEHLRRKLSDNKPTNPNIRTIDIVIVALLVITIAVRFF